jgi:hypothetical protein
MSGDATYQIWAVGAIVVGSGVFGGWTAFLSDQAQHRVNPEQANSPYLLRYIALGLSATICVPLFLSLVQSALIPKIFNPDKVDGVVTTPYSDFLIFGGICILAAISARKFLDTLSDKILRDVSQLKKKTDRIDQKAVAAEERAARAEEKAQDASSVSLDVLDEQAAEPRLEPELSELGAAPAGPTLDLTPLEQKTLSSLMKVTFRTATGIGQNLGIPRNQIGDLLDSLASKRLVERTTSPATGGPRWKITALGVRTLR